MLFFKNASLVISGLILCFTFFSACSKDEGKAKKNNMAGNPPGSPSAQSDAGIVITASSVLRSQLGADRILTETSPIWHAKSPPNYPEWVEIKYPQPMIVTRLKMWSQPTSPGGNEYVRAPKDFILQASNDHAAWQDLLHVNDNLYTEGSQAKEWLFSNSTAFNYYRVYITAGGDTKLLTIYQINLG